MMHRNLCLRLMVQQAPWSLQHTQASGLWCSKLPSPYSTLKTLLPAYRTLQICGFSCSQQQ